MQWSDFGDISADLAEMGMPVEINGQPTHAIVKRREIVSDGMGGMIVTDPTAKIASNDVEALLIKGGEAGSELLVGTKYYRVLSVIDDGDGFTTLRLAAS